MGGGKGRWIILDSSGFPEAAQAIRVAWERGDHEAATRAVPDVLIDATSVVGTPAECRARLEAYRRLGIALPIISPFSREPHGKERAMEAIRACAPIPSSSRSRVIHSPSGFADRTGRRCCSCRRCVRPWRLRAPADPLTCAVEHRSLFVSAGRVRSASTSTTLEARCWPETRPGPRRRNSRFQRQPASAFWSSPFIA